MADSYAIGKGKPPQATRFQKGRSGNPSGRPKGSRNLLGELKHELANKVTVRENGQAKRISKRTAILKSLVARALGGDVKAMNAIFALIAQSDLHEMPAVAVSIEQDELRILERYAPRAAKAAGHRKPAKPKKGRSR